MTPQQQRELEQHLTFIYGDQGEDTVKHTLSELRTLLETFSEQHPDLKHTASERLSEKDAVLITYGDQISEPNKAPLKSLGEFAQEHLKGVLNGIHLLPFYPYTSDDGFSVVDYLQVDPKLGSWEDVETLGQSFRLMFDAVINHVSASSPWFQGFLQGDPDYRDYFITVDPDTDLSSIVRPRATPLLTPFETSEGTKHVWTTFSADQIDLNYAHPPVLLEVTRTLLEYVARGAEIIRLDAITYLWKEIGSSGVHHPKTHRVMQLLRSVMNIVAPRVVLLTETNVPHQENISYFGDGYNEAQMVYNFALPPLTLHAFMRGDASTLEDWANTLDTPSGDTCFFNFLASHDGVGVRPVEGMLPEADVAALVERARSHGGLVSTKRNADGSESPYELNINYFDALSNPNAGEALELQVSRFLCAQSIMLTLAGVPGIYVHSLLGSRSDHEGVEKTGRNRSINREKFERGRLERELSDPEHLRHRVFSAYRSMLQTRRAEPAFHPQAPQRILNTPRAIFGLERTRPDGSGALYCLHNLSDTFQDVQLPIKRARDLLTGERLDTAQRVTLEPYQVRWLSEG